MCSSCIMNAVGRAMLADWILVGVMQILVRRARLGLGLFLLNEFASLGQ